MYIDSLYFHYAFQNFPFFCHSLYNRKILHKTLIEFYTDFKKRTKYQKHYYKSVTYLKFQPHFSNFPISYFHDKSAESTTRLRYTKATTYIKHSWTHSSESWPIYRRRISLIRICRARKRLCFDRPTFERNPKISLPCPGKCERVAANCRTRFTV